MRVKADTRTTWREQLTDSAWARYESRCIFSIDTTFDRMTLDLNLALTIR